jgi:hypothetical protein
MKKNSPMTRSPNFHNIKKENDTVKVKTSYRFKVST